MNNHASKTSVARRTLGATSLTLAITLALGLALPAAAQQYTYPDSSTNTTVAQHADAKDARADRADRAERRLPPPNRQGANRQGNPDPGYSAPAQGYGAPQSHGTSQGYGAPQAVAHPNQPQVSEYGERVQRGRHAVHPAGANQQGNPDPGYSAPVQGYGTPQTTGNASQPRPTEYGESTQRGKPGAYGDGLEHARPAHGTDQNSPAESPQSRGNNVQFHNTVHPIKARTAYGNQPRPTEYGESTQRGKPGAYGDGLERARPAHGTGQNSPAESPQSRGNNVQFHNTVHPIEARTAYGNARQSGHGPTQGNPSMHRGEACSPNSPCGVSPSGSSGAAGADHGASHARSGDQAQRYSGANADRYSRAAQVPHATEAGKPVRADVSEQHLNPALTHGARVSATGQHSNANFNNAMNGKSGVTGGNLNGQQSAVTGPNGQKVSLGGSQTYTGPGGQKQTFGGSQTITGPNGQKQTFGTGATTATHTGGSNDMPNQNSLNTNGSGLSNVSDNSKTHPIQGYDDITHIDVATNKRVPNASSKSGGDSEKAAESDGLLGLWHNAFGGSDDSSKGKGSSSKQEGGGVGDDPDVGQRSGGSLVNSGTGKRVQPGKHQGQDNGGGGGQTGEFNSKGGGANSQGKTFRAPIGQDVTKGPRKKLIVPMKTDDNGKNGVTDPAQNGNGGG